ncbi:MAG: SGNH/GDSL hydrolase family protein [Myxococcota bacterium]|nr:SGNH/GDSL hydrolase family protein [Myxococcota bacterium]
MRRRVLLLALFATTALLCLLAIDRIVYWYFPLGRIVYQTDPVQLYSYIPGASKYFIHTAENGGDWVSVHINDQGHRGVDVGPKGETLRILVFGDSYVAAEYSPLEETYPYRLTDEIRTLTGKPVETINAGLVGAGPDQVARIMPEAIRKLKPDIVALVITSGNDFGDLIRNKLYAVDRQGGWSEKEPPLGPGLRKMLEPDLYSQSGWGRLLRAAWRGTPLRMEQAGLTHRSGPAPGYQDAHQLIRRHQLEYGNSQIDLDPVVRNLFDDLYDADLSLLPHSPSAQRKRLLMRIVLTEIKRIAEQAQVPLLIVVVPSPIDVLDDHFGLQARWDQFPDYDRSTLTRAVAESAQDLDLPVLNLFAPMREAPDPSALFFKAGNDHWNAQGQSMAARMTAARLQELGWLRQEDRESASTPPSP